MAPIRNIVAAQRIIAVYKPAPVVLESCKVKLQLWQSLVFVALMIFIANDVMNINFSKQSALLNSEF